MYRKGTKNAGKQRKDLTGSGSAICVQYRSCAACCRSEIAGNAVIFFRAIRFSAPHETRAEDDPRITALPIAPVDLFAWSDRRILRLGCEASAIKS